MNCTAVYTGELFMGTWVWNSTPSPATEGGEAVREEWRPDM